VNTVIRKHSGVMIVDVIGNIDLGSSPVLRKALLESLGDTTRLMLNLGDVKYIDSSGIASLLEVLKAARSEKKAFVLFGLTAAVREVLQLTRLTGVFEIHETELEALQPAGGLS
jgi:anti-sigma B factor antagonist